MERPFRREVRNDADQRAPRTPASSAWSMMTLSGLRSAGTAHLASVTVFTLAVAGTTGLLVADPMAGPATAVAPDGVLPEGAWVDEFDAGTLDPRWSIHNEAAEQWALDEDAGALVLTSQPGDTYQGDNTARNIFLLDVPAGDFTLVTSVEAPVSADFQGAGLIAWQDPDNYVRAGLTHVSSADAGPVVIENGVETGAVYSSTFTARPGSTGETLRLQRVGDVITTSYWAEGVWVQAAQATVTFDTIQVGLYALAAGGAPPHQAVFDFVGLVAAPGQDVVPDGTFTLNGPGDLRYLTVAGAVQGERAVGHNVLARCGAQSDEVEDRLVRRRAAGGERVETHLGGVEGDRRLRGLDPAAIGPVAGRDDVTDPLEAQRLARRPGSGGERRGVHSAGLDTVLDDDRPAVGEADVGQTRSHVVVGVLPGDQTRTLEVGRDRCLDRGHQREVAGRDVQQDDVACRVVTLVGVARLR